MSNPERDQLTNRKRNVCLTATKRLLLIMPIVLLSTAAVVVAAQEVLRNPSTISTAQERYFMNQNKYVGMWVTADGHIRHELLPKGRYDEARGNRKSAYQGNYRLEGDHIEYVDDTGFTADGDFRDGVLYHAGMVLYREQ